MIMTQDNMVRDLFTDDGIDPRILRTRKLIMNGFHELLTEKNFQSITVSEITTRANINRATFYAHFADKYTLFDYVIAQFISRLT